MNILFYSSQAWPSDWHTPDPGPHEIRQQHGDVAHLLSLIQLNPPDLLVLSGPSPDDAMLRCIESLSLSHPRMLVLLHQSSMSSERLLQWVRAGVRDVLPDLSAARWNEALNRAQQRLLSERIRKTRILGVISVKDGDGGPCVAANLGHALAGLTQDDVLLIDLNLPFGDLDMYLTDRSGLKDIADVSAEAERMDGSLLQSMVHPLNDHLHLIASPATFEKVLHVQAEQIQKMLEVASKHYATLLLSMGSSIDKISLSALSRADDVYLVASPTLPSVRRLSQWIKLLRSLDHPDERVHVLVKHIDLQSAISQAEMEKVIGKTVRMDLMLEESALAEALLKGKPMVSLQPESRFSTHIQSLASEISGISLNKPSLWQRLRKK